MESSRKTAVEILTQVLKNKAYSNIALGKGLDRSSLDPKDKALVTEIVYGTLKYKYTIDTILSHFLKNGIKKADEAVLNILRISVYQLRYLDKIPQFAVVNEAVELAKKKSSGAGRLVNGILRNYLRNPDISYYDQSNFIEKLCFEYSFPEWLVRMFISQYSQDEAENILRGLNIRPAVTVRVNALKTSYEDAMESLKGYGYDVTGRTGLP